MCQMAMSALGWELQLGAICIKGSFAQEVYFAKSRERIIADLHSLVARCNTVFPKRTLVMIVRRNLAA
jgi:hypothetical protein